MAIILVSGVLASDNDRRTEEIRKHISRFTSKPTVWTLRRLRNVSTHISLGSPRRLFRDDIIRLSGIDVYNNDAWNRKSTAGEKCLSELACAACLGRSGSIFTQSPHPPCWFSRGTDHIQWLILKAKHVFTNTRFSFIQSKKSMGPVPKNDNKPEEEDC